MIQFSWIHKSNVFPKFSRFWFCICKSCPFTVCSSQCWKTVCTNLSIILQYQGIFKKSCKCRVSKDFFLLARKNNKLNKLTFLNKVTIISKQSSDVILRIYFNYNRINKEYFVQFCYTYVHIFNIIYNITLFKFKIAETSMIQNLWLLEIHLTLDSNKVQYSFLLVSTCQSVMLHFTLTLVVIWNQIKAMLVECLCCKHAFTYVTRVHLSGFMSTQ